MASLETWNCKRRVPRSERRTHLLGDSGSYHGSVGGECPQQSYNTSNYRAVILKLMVVYLPKFAEPTTAGSILWFDMYPL